MTVIKKFPKDLDIKDKSVIIRLDLNVPLKNKIIQDDTRIKLVLPFLNELVLKKAKIIIITHLGRPKGVRDNNFSLAPIYKYLKKKINTNVFFFMGDIDDETKNKSSHLKSGEILLLENIRFFKGEKENEENFAQKLASLGDIFINDAFSCSHRKQASIHKITKFMKNCYAGPLCEKEIKAIDLVIKSKTKPLTCIIGGSKISTKINVISKLIQSVDNIIIVGAMANNFLAYKGYEIGKSLIEKDSEDIIEKIYKEVEKFKCNIVIPVDCNISHSFDGAGISKKADSIKKDEIILDIGPETIKKIEKIIEESKTVLWNGPAGYFENIKFATGTNAIALKISERTSQKSLKSILGGGDTISAINMIKKRLSFSHLSTAGGAFLEYLEGKDLPGLSVLK